MLPHRRLRRRADHFHRLPVHRADAHLFGNQHAADIEVVQRVADVSQLKRVQLPRIREGKRGLRRLDFFALQKGTSFIVSQMAYPAIFSGYSIS